MRRVVTTNSALTPLLMHGIDIFSDENNLPCPADQLIFFGAGGRSDKRNDRAAVRRRDRYPAANAFNVVVGHQTESELVQVELQAPIMIADENRGEENAQVGRLTIQAQSGSVRPL